MGKRHPASQQDRLAGRRPVIHVVDQGRRLKGDRRMRRWSALSKAVRPDVTFSMAVQQAAVDAVIGQRKPLPQKRSAVDGEVLAVANVPAGSTGLWRPVRSWLHVQDRLLRRTAGRRDGHDATLTARRPSGGYVQERGRRRYGEQASRKVLQHRRSGGPPVDGGSLTAAANGTGSTAT